MKNVKQNQRDRFYKQETNVDWVVRHCSPDIIVDGIAFADWYWHQPNTACVCSRCASMDRSSIHIEDDH